MSNIEVWWSGWCKATCGWPSASTSWCETKKARGTSRETKKKMQRNWAANKSSRDRRTVPTDKPQTDVNIWIIWSIVKQWQQDSQQWDTWFVRVIILIFYCSWDHQRKLKPRTHRKVTIRSFSANSKSTPLKWHKPKGPQYLKCSWALWSLITCSTWPPSLQSLKHELTSWHVHMPYDLTVPHSTKIHWQSDDREENNHTRVG